MPKNGIDYRIHKDDELFALEELIDETRFADLLIISGESFYSNLGEKQPNDYMQRVLHKSECPVLIVPEEYKTIDNIIPAYDGTESAVYGVKQFAYLFPGLCDKETTLLYANNKEDDLPECDRMSELAARHYTNLSLQKLEIPEPGKFFHK